jgi:hypothetical protein
MKITSGNPTFTVPKTVSDVKGTPASMTAGTAGGMPTQDVFAPASASSGPCLNLMADGAPLASVDDVLAGRISLVPGSQGDAVKAVQKALNVEQTGLLGPTTAAAIVAFKENAGIITPSGLDPATIGPTTMKALLKAAAASPTDISAQAKQQMAGLLSIAQNNCLTDDSASWGHCYGSVWGYLMQAQKDQGYGNGKLPGCDVPGSFAAQFGEWLNQGDNAASVGLKRLDVSNPFDAPPGAIVVVGAGSPGCSSHASHGESYAVNNGVSYADYQAHPNWPGDISVATGDGVNFINDHNDESYGGSREGWERAAQAGTATLVGVYVPI